MTSTPINPNRMAHITMRIPHETLDFYKRHDNPRTFMREVLVAYANMKAAKAVDNVK